MECATVTKWQRHGERLWHESLRAYADAQGQMWFCRDWNPESRLYEWSPGQPAGFPRDTRLENDTLSNVLYLSKHIASNRTEMEPVFRWFKERLTFLHLDANWSLSGDYTMDRLREKDALAERIVSLLRHADLGIVEASRVERDRPKESWRRSRACPSLRAERSASNSANQALSRNYSTAAQKAALILCRGRQNPQETHRLFAISGLWLNILKDGDVVGIDELDTSMHPLMVAELLRLLLSAEHSPNKAQVIFTTHNPLLLDPTLLRRDQVWFADKDATGEGHLYPLTDYTPRTEESLVRGYLSGRYGAVPFVPKGLLGQRADFARARSEGGETET